MSEPERTPDGRYVVVRNYIAAAVLNASDLSLVRTEALRAVGGLRPGFEGSQDHDLLLAMDGSNLADIGGRSDRVRLFRDFDPVGTGGEVPDPYYGGDSGFEEVLSMVERTCAALVLSLIHI